MSERDQIGNGCGAMIFFLIFCVVFGVPLGILTMDFWTQAYDYKFGTHLTSDKPIIKWPVK